MIVYISGPIGSMPDGNRAAFAEAEELWKAAGHAVINPHTVDPDHFGECQGDEVLRADGEPPAEHRYGCYMIADIAALLLCDAIYMLPGWGNSRGASVELTVANICGIKRVTLDVA